MKISRKTKECKIIRFEDVKCGDVFTLEWIGGVYVKTHELREGGEVIMNYVRLNDGGCGRIVNQGIKVKLMKEELVLEEYDGED